VLINFATGKDLSRAQCPTSDTFVNTFGLPLTGIVTIRSITTSYIGADYDTDHNLVRARVRKRLSVSQRAA
jgi:hypothetical protein